MAHAKPSTAATRRAERTAAAAALAAAGGASAAQAESTAPAADESTEGQPGGEQDAGSGESSHAAAGSESAAESEDGDCDCPEDTDPDDCDCDDLEDDDDDMAQAARGRERARVAAILRHPNAQGRESVAQQLAFDTRLSRKEARGVLAKLGPVAAGKPGGLSAAMATVPPPKPNTGGAPSSQTSETALAESWDRAFKRK